MIRIVLIDDHQGITEGLGALIGLAPDMTVVGTAHDVVSAAALIQRTSPDVVLCDVRLHTEDGGLDLLTDHASRSAFIMLSAHMHPSRVVTAVSRGARGYLSKMTSIEEIAAAVRVVVAGGTAFPDQTRHAIRLSLQPPTRQELAILMLLAEGRPYLEIAERLSLSIRTVESHLRRLFVRYEVMNRVALVRLARMQGWIE